MTQKSHNTGETRHTTLRQQLLRSHLRVAGLAALVLLLAAVAMEMLREPITTSRLINVPSANAAMTVQLGLQRSEANLRGWVALKNPALRENVNKAWRDEIWPAFETLKELSMDYGTPERQLRLSKLDDSLSRLRKLQDWTIDVAAKSGNEPAKLVFSQEFGPTREKLVEKIDKLRYKQVNPGAAARESFFRLRLGLSEAEAALGRFVVEGHEADASKYLDHIKRVRRLTAWLSTGSITGSVSLLPVQITEQLDELERLSDSIIASKRSPRSNVAWHTISTRVEPLSAEIAVKLAAISDREVSAMRIRVEQIAIWTNLLSVCSIIALFVVVFLALIISSTQAKRISAPVTQLYRATEALKDGDYSKALRPEGVFEVHGLISAFNAMRESISQSHKALREIAYTDELTGLANRKAFNDSIAALHSDETAESEQAEERFAGVIMIDLDYFKQVNDSLGHDAGDRLLSVFGSRLQESLDPGDCAARVGGDEFAVVLDSLPTAGHARPIVEKIRSATSKPIVYNSEKIQPSATIGIAVEPLLNLDTTDLVKKADLALYDAKATGRGSYSFYSSEIHEKTTRYRRIGELIEHNSPEDLFKLVYQPYIELHSGRIVGVEALLRCVHTVCEGISTIDVITMLERNGYISRVSKWVMTEATNQLVQWQNTMDLPHDFTMSVNVSASLLPDTDFVQSVLDIVEKSGLDGNSITVELTETTVMEDYTRSKDAMSRLNDVGIEFAMDDFGTGHSSLVRLKEMPLSLLKIDQTFVKGMMTSTNDAAIVDASVRLGHAIGMSVTAEGIETAEQAEALRKLGCNRGQGYYFAFPQSPEELEVMLTPYRRAA